MTITAVLDVRLVPDRTRECYPIMHENLEETRSYPGNVSVDVWIDDDDPGHVAFVERWESPEALTQYREWRRGEGKSMAMVPYLQGAPVMTFYTAAPEI